jgi:glycerol-3-phosphate acyltransferase PlsY
MEFINNGNIIFIGFVVWLIMAPQMTSFQSSQAFLAYMVALLFSLLVTSDLLFIKPVAFFFTVGGVLAFLLVVARTTIRIASQKEE